MFENTKAQTLSDWASRAVLALERYVDNGSEVEPEVAPSGGRKSGGDYVPMTVESSGTHLYFYARVNTDRCLDLIKRIRELDGELRNERERRMLGPDFPDIPIWLHIQSGGGELFTGLNIADQIATIQTPVFSIVEGYCASAATLISMACTKRYIQPSSFVLIHQLSSWAMGTYEQLQDDQHISDLLMERLYDFYTDRSKIKKAEVKKLLRRDSWFKASEAVELGLADEILVG